jgi:carbamoyltransferase
MLICGIHDGHNAAACLVRDGLLVSALQEERLTRIKNWTGFPARSIEAQLNAIGATWRDVDAYVFAGHEHYYLPGTGPGDRAAQIVAYKERANLGGYARRLARHTPLRTLTHQHRWGERIVPVLRHGVAAGAISSVDHHRCHGMTAYYGAGSRPDVLVVTLDGAGDGVCATVSVPEESGVLRRVCEVKEEHSIGILWALQTSLMGMVPNEHEYKMMGMAPYASLKAAREVADIFRRGYEMENGGWRRTDGLPEAMYAYNYWRERLEFKRFDAICGGLQLFTEEFVCNWVQYWLKRSGLRAVRLSGGVFMNVKMNKAIMELPELEEIFVFPSCGDETNCIGAAWAHLEDHGKSHSIQPIGPLYLGPAPSRSEYELAATTASAAQCTVHRPDNMAEEVAALLSRGEIVARFADREEFGARALGNRSILADPSRTEVVRSINRAIKSRDFWMPFACSIMEEEVERFVDNPKRVSAPYMIMTFDARHVDKIIAGCHPEDHTVRPQIVAKEWNKDYYQIISAFREKTGVGALLNTSFNLHGEPIVSKPAEAVDVLLRSGLRHLCLGPYLIAK